jgi:anti-anti-sigma factor
MTSSEAAKDLLETIGESASEAIDAGVPSVAAAAAVVAPVTKAVSAIDVGADVGADADAWQVIQVCTRLDAETHPELMAQIHETLAEGHSRVALDLSGTQFFSLAAIQLCMGLARDLAGENGALALVGCSERTKKHFDVYGSLKQITLARTLAELVSDRGAAVVIRPRFSREPR